MMRNNDFIAVYAGDCDDAKEWRYLPYISTLEEDMVLDQQTWKV